LTYVSIYGKILAYNFRLKIFCPIALLQAAGADFKATIADCLELPTRPSGLSMCQRVFCFMKLAEMSSKPKVVLAVSAFFIV